MTNTFALNGERRCSYLTISSLERINILSGVFWWKSVSCHDPTNSNWRNRQIRQQTVLVGRKRLWNAAFTRREIICNCFDSPWDHVSFLMTNMLINKILFSTPFKQKQMWDIPYVIPMCLCSHTRDLRSIVSYLVTASEGMKHLWCSS